MNTESVLYKRTRVFMDINNVFFYTDLFLYHELAERMSHNQQLKFLFKANLPKLPEVDGDRWLIHELSGKNHHNILEDWLDEKSCEELEKVCKFDRVSFLASLYKDMLTNPTCGQYLQMTELGNAIGLLSADANFRELVLYMPFKSEFILGQLSERIHGMAATKIKVRHGDRGFLKEDVNFDSYILEIVQTIDNFLCVPRMNMAEVLIPTYPCNLSDKRTELDELLEQVTFHQLNIKEEPVTYKEKFKLSINSIHVPL